jgi:hypothetical protein
MPEVVRTSIYDLEDDTDFEEYAPFMEVKGSSLDDYSWIGIQKIFDVIPNRNRPLSGLIAHTHQTYKDSGQRIGYKGWLSKGTALHGGFRIVELRSVGATVDSNPEVDDHFRALRDAWRLERRGISSTERMLLCPAYQRIIGLGLGWKDQVIRLIMRELQEQPDFWFAALRALTGEDPVVESARGNVRKMSEAWLTWGRDRNFIGAAESRYDRGGFPEFNF